MNKQWGFENRIKETKKEKLFFYWKGSVLFIILLSFLSFFSIVDEFVYADKTTIISKFEKFDELKFTKNIGISSHIGKMIKNYNGGGNILKEDKIGLNLIQDNLGFILSILGYGEYKTQIIKIYNKIKPYKNQIYELLGENEKKNYLIIFQNTSEERPDGGFFGSFAKLSFDQARLVDFKILDSYYLLWRICGTQGENWFDKCENNKDLIINNSNDQFSTLWPNTTFLTSNIFGFTDLNGENVINHYNKVFDEKIEGVIFLKSDILKYLLPNGQEVIWNMEIMNSISKSQGNYEDSDKIKGLGGAKDKYLKYLKSLLSNKKQIIINLIKNYEKITTKGFIRIYLRGIDSKFIEFLQKENLIFLQGKDFAYLFFYNIGFNKISKFVDHVVIVNDKLFLNPEKFELVKGKNIIEFKNILNDNFEYWDFLKEQKVEKSYYLRSKKINYDNLLILPNNCKVQNKSENMYSVECF